MIEELLIVSTIMGAITLPFLTSNNGTIVRDLEPVEPEPVVEFIDLGEFTVTAYCGCEKCCGSWATDGPTLTASGAYAHEGITVASDWNTLPPGTVVVIEGREYTVQDKVADWIVDRYQGKIIDIYFESHEDALEWGKKTVNVCRKEETNGL